MSDQDRTRATYVELVAALRAEFGPGALEATRIQLLPHQRNRTSLSILVQAVIDAVDVTFIAAPPDNSCDVAGELQTAQDQLFELEARLAAEQQQHEDIRYRMREADREREDLDYRLRDVERERDELRRQVADLDSQLYSARREANAARGGWF
jgi:septal ring factor EnvC (AmiA/AmiB activator)